MPNSTISKKVDSIVGEEIRKNRTLKGMTQEGLARHLGVSYQQLQKYETSANRISAGKLYQISEILDQPVESFFNQKKIKAKGVSPTILPHGGIDRGLINFINLYKDLPFEDRTAVLSMMKLLDKKNNLAAPNNGDAKHLSAA